MATAQPLDTRANERRARELAEARHTEGTGRWVGDPMTTAEMAVASRSRAGVEYAVRRLTADHWTCSCPAVGPCCHIGAALKAFEQRERAMSAAGRAWQDGYDQFCEAHGF